MDSKKETNQCNHTSVGRVTHPKRSDSRITLRNVTKIQSIADRWVVKKKPISVTIYQLDELLIHRSDSRITLRNVTKTTALLINW